MARAAVAAEGFVGHFGDVRAAHDYGNADGADRIRHAVSLGDHSGHGADADQINLLLDYISRDSGFVHGLGVSVDQHNVVAGGG